jgi:hypothetical protein
MSENEPTQRPEADPAPHARHGYRNEVNWEGGSGRQPYTNQRSGVPSPGAAHETPEGNRGQRSGVTQQQVEQTKSRP